MIMMPRSVTVALVLQLSASILMGCRRTHVPLVTAQEQEEMAREIEVYREWALRPARLPPPLVAPGPLAADGDHENTSRRQLVHKGLRDLRRCRRHDDRVEGRTIGETE